MRRGHRQARASGTRRRILFGRAVLPPPLAVPKCPQPTAPEPLDPEPSPAPQPSPASAEALARTQADLAACEAQLAGSQAEVEALTAYCRAVEQRAGELQQALTEVRIPPLDIVICLDITGSMSEQIQGLKQEIDDLARVLDRLAPSVGIGVVAYGDRLFDRVTERHAIVSTAAMGSLRRFVQTLESKGTTLFSNPNPDVPEAVDRALAEAAAMNWRPESERRYIIVIGDAPAYPEERASAFARAAWFAAADGRHVSAVMVARRERRAVLPPTGSLGTRTVRGRCWGAVDDRKHVVGDFGCLRLLRV